MTDRDRAQRLQQVRALQARGAFTQALAESEALLTRRPGDRDANHLAGVLLLQLGRPAEAAPHLETAIAQAPDRPEIAAGLSAALVQLGRHDEAVPVCERALAIHPGAIDLWVNLGTALSELGRLEPSETAYRRALALNPDDPNAVRGLALAHHRRGMARLKLGEAQAATEAFRAAIGRRPDYAAAYTGLGAALRQTGDHAGALSAYRTAIALDDGVALTHYNLANLLQELDDPEAEQAFRRAIALQPDWPSAHFNYGLWLLKQGRYDAGWAEYEWRWRTERFKAVARPYPCPQWTGQPLAGATVLVHAEQGLGDLIQCARYVPLIAERDGRVVLEAPSSLHALLSDLAGVVAVIEPGAPAPGCDYHCPCLSLPLGFATRLDSIPARVPYLPFEAERAAGWSERLPAGVRVGIVWQGNPDAQVERGRSFALAEMAPLAAVPGVRLISLQKTHGLDQLAGPGLDFGVTVLGEAYDRGDFAETAAVIANLDLVVACDTAVAHLAGALGRPVWLALKRDNDWRWLTVRADSPWYPTARLYRQETRGDWVPVFAGMARDLAGLARRSS